MYVSMYVCMYKYDSLTAYIRELIKEEYLVIILRYVFYLFLYKSHVVGTH